MNERQTSRPTFATFQPATVAEFMKLLSSSPTKHCQLDRVPTLLVKQCTCSLRPCVMHRSVLEDFRRQRNTPWSPL